MVFQSLSLIFLYLLLLGLKPIYAETIRFVTWKPNQPEVWEEVIALFERENPDIKVEREIGPHSSTEYHALLTQKLKNRDTSVDVFFMDVIWPSEFAAAGWALPLDRYFPEDRKREFMDAPIKANTYNGRIYGVPFWLSSGMLYYRKDLLEEYGFEPPETWNELLLQVEKILDRQKNKHPDLKGYSGQFKQYEGLICNMLEFIMGNGGSLLDEAGTRPLIAEDKAIEAVRFVRDKVIGGIAPRGVLTYEEPESLELFIQGNAIFHRNWPYAWEVANNPDKSRVAGKVGIARLPSFPSGRSVAALGGWQFGISAYSKRPDSAWRFIEFMTSERIQRFFALRAAQAPARKSLYTDSAILEKHPHFSSLYDVFITSHPRPRTPIYPMVSNILQRYFHRAILKEDSDIPALAKEAEREIEKVIRLMR